MKRSMNNNGPMLKVKHVPLIDDGYKNLRQNFDAIFEPADTYLD